MLLRRDVELGRPTERGGGPPPPPPFYAVGRTPPHRKQVTLRKSGQLALG